MGQRLCAPISATAAVGWMLCVMPTELTAQIQFEREPIRYSKTTPQNRITALIDKIDSGSVALDYSDNHGYLPSLLKHLEVPVESQVLVFSKTSHQRHRISPTAPRAVYFNDDIYLGWVQEGAVIEISVADSQLGAVFYTIDQTTGGSKAALTREFGRCTLCHASTSTGRIPGHIVRSVYPNQAGRPVLAAGTFRTTPRSPLPERWGGWYVTGTHGNQRHMGNVWVKNESAWREIDVEAGANVVDLSSRFDTSPYLTPHSDIVALMVMEHQVDMHNRFTAASIDWRLHWHEAQRINREKGRPTDHRTDESHYKLDIAARRVVDGLLMKDETKLTDPIEGTSRFAKQFSELGPIASDGSGLRQLDLQSRLFRYPVSYMIYTSAFDALPDQLLDRIYQQLWDELTETSETSSYDLDLDKRRAALTILRETKKGLPASWMSP